MTSAPALMIAWIQFVVAGILLLSGARIAMRWMVQPAERIRLIQITLAAVLAVPLLLVLAPLPTWRLGLLPPLSGQAQVDEVIQPIVAAPERQTLTPAPAPTETADRTDSRQLDQDIIQNQPVAQAHVSIAGAMQPSASAFADLWWIAVTLVCLLHVIAVVVFLVEWRLGAARLRGLCRSATPAPASIIALWDVVSAGRARNVRLLLSTAIDTPLTFGWLNPVVMLPYDLAAANGSALRYCLTHEYSHIERNDMLAWRGVWACQFLLWYQPLFWGLRRELRICQDILADDRSTGAGHDAFEYSELLVGLARKHRAASLAGALTLLDHPSQLTRRIKMLLERSTPLRSGCTWWFSLAVTATATLSVILAASIRLDAAPEANTPTRKVEPQSAPELQLAAAEQQAQTKEKPAPTTEKPAAKDERLTYQCIVVDKATGKGIPNAKVTVRRSKLTAQQNTPIEETRHTTDADGKYMVEIPPEQVADRYLYIELDVEHDQYAGRKGFGYALSMIRKNEALGERPFFERTELPAAEPITGRVLSPDGTPVPDVKIQGFSMDSARDLRGYHSFVDSLTGEDGTFRLNLLKDGEGVFWIIPKDYAIVQKYVAKQRGDQGEFRLQPGIRTKGRVLSADGKPLSGVAVNIDYRGARDVGGLPVASSIRRGAISDEEGRFAFDPLPAGDYRVIAEDHLGDPLARDRTVRPVPGVFVARRVTLKDGTEAAPLEIQAVPHVLFNAQIVDSKGAKSGGHAFHMFGKLDGESWFGQGRPDPSGTISLRVPHGLQDVEVRLSTNEHGALRYRRTKDGPLENERSIKFGTLNDDVDGFEIVRYRAPLVLIAAVDEEQKPIKTFRVAGTYPWGKQEYVREGEQRSDLHFDHQNDGRYRTSQMLPDEEVTFTVTAAGYQPAIEKAKLGEGESKELVVTLKAAEEKKP